jgi:GrpB-like predicted nucleotidyltransferase (UPF0157 family)
VSDLALPMQAPFSCSAPSCTMESVPIRVVPYDPDWAIRFEQERALLAEALAPWLSDGVHHIGSTAVPGLAAKPILDMMAGVAELAAARPAIAVLEGHGWVHAPHRPEAYWFYRPRASVGHEHTHHLHLTQPGSALWRERLAFRDALRADPALRSEYQALKRHLAQMHGDDGGSYTADKRAFVARVLAQVGIALAPRPDQRDYRR